MSAIVTVSASRAALNDASVWGIVSADCANEIDRETAVTDRQTPE